VQESCKNCCKRVCLPEFLGPTILLGALLTPIILLLISNLECHSLNSVVLKVGRTFGLMKFTLRLTLSNDPSPLRFNWLASSIL
jgi:hypothetical protein